MNYLSDYKNKHLGERLFLACTGPSLNDVPVEKLSKEWVMTLNRGYLKAGLNPDYLVTADKRIENNRDFVNQILELDVTVFSNSIKGDNVVNFNLVGGSFSKDASKGVRLGHSVTVVALQLAYFMGFDRVYIVGMNHEIVYDNAKRTGMEFQNIGKDINHFHPGYYGKGHRYRYQNLDAVSNSYLEAREAYELDGRKLYNATTTTKLSSDIIPRVTLEEIL